MSAAQRLRPRIPAKARAKITAPKRSELAAKRLPSRRAARVAKDQEMAALCQRRASRWADAIREGLDPDIARFVRDQAAAWQLVATSYARSAKDGLVGPADAR